MILIDRGGRVNILDRGVPPFPHELEGKLEAMRMVAQERDAEKKFFAWYSEACRAHGVTYPKTGTPEDWQHLRKLLARYELEALGKLMSQFLTTESERLRAGYHHHLRLFRAWLKEGY